MDFRKVLTAFLIVFIALDIFLGFQWVQQYPFSDHRDPEKQVLNEMRDDGITYDNLSKSRHTGSYIAGKDGRDDLANNQTQLNSDWQTDMNDDVLTVSMTKPYRLAESGENNVNTKALNKFIKKDQHVINGDQYRFSSKLTKIAQSNNKKKDTQPYVYVQKIAKEQRPYLTNRGQITFEVSDEHRLKKYEQQYISDTQFLRNDVQLISEQQALIALYQYNDLPDGSQIKQSKLGYEPLTTVDDDIIFVPVWQFAMTSKGQNMSVASVNAINGTIMK